MQLAYFVSGGERGSGSGQVNGRKFSGGVSSGGGGGSTNTNTAEKIKNNTFGGEERLGFRDIIMPSYWMVIFDSAQDWI